MTKAVKNRVEQLDAIHKEALAEYVGVLANNRVGTNQIAVRIGSSGGRFAIRGTNVIDVLESLYAGEPSVQSIRQNNQILASTRDGQLYVSAKVFDASFRQIVEIVDNEWKVTASIGTIVPSEAVPIPMVFTSKPEFEVSNSHILLPAVSTLVRSEAGASFAGFNVVFQPGLATPYVLRTANVLEGQSIFLPRDFYLNPGKYGKQSK